MSVPNVHRVLVIDDTPAIHEDFAKVFKRTDPKAGALDEMATALFGGVAEGPVDGPDFQLASAHQGREGAEIVRRALAERLPFTLAFVDMRMPPGWDGLETVQELWKLDPRLQVVICTAHSDHSWHKIHTTLGPTDNLIILQKPFDPIEARQLAHTLARKWTLARAHESRLSELDSLVQARTRELQLAEARFSRAFDANPHAQALIALDAFEVLAVNPAFSRQFGLSLEGLQRPGVKDAGPGMHSARLQGLAEKLIATGKLDDLPLAFEHPLGTAREARCSAHLVMTGPRLCSIWLFQDVTEKVQLEQQLRQAQKMEAVGQLAAGIAHDFNNVLTVIKAYVSMLLDSAAADRAHLIELQQIRDAADRAAALTGQLLVFSRRHVTRLDPCDVTVAMDGVRGMLQRLLPDRVRLEWKAAAGIPQVLGDRANLEQVLMNLVINARDAIRGPGVITVTMDAVTLSEPEASSRPQARAGVFSRLSVRDTGCGMAPEIQNRIFEPFFTTKESGKGTGLGLSTVFGIVEQHGGWLEVTSAVGEGTAFAIYLPALEPGAASAAVAPASARVETPGRGERILIVEDDHHVRAAVTQLAISAGYRVTAAEDGHAALREWQSAAHRFDLVLADVDLPNGLNGIELVRQLRRDKPELKAVLASGYSDQLRSEAGEGIGELPLLLKPYTYASVMETLHAALRGGAGDIVAGIHPHFHSS